MPRSSARNEARPRPTLRAAQRQATHELLLAAATARFVATGYVATKVEDIVLDVGTTRATFYKHFNGKATVVEELLAVHLERLAPFWEPLQALSSRPTAAELRRWAQLAAETWEPHAELQAIIAEAAHVEPGLALLRQSAVEAGFEHFVEAVRHMAWPDDAHARIECRLLWAQIREVFEYWTTTPARERDTRILDALADNWRAALDRAAAASVAR